LKKSCRPVRVRWSKRLKIWSSSTAVAVWSGPIVPPFDLVAVRGAELQVDVPVGDRTATPAYSSPGCRAGAARSPSMMLKTTVACPSMGHVNALDAADRDAAGLDLRCPSRPGRR
jgi:hypothetical protein